MDYLLIKGILYSERAVSVLIRTVHSVIEVRVTLILVLASVAIQSNLNKNIECNKNSPKESSYVVHTFLGSLSKVVSICWFNPPQINYLTGNQIKGVNMKQCLLKVMLVLVLMTIAAFAWGQSIFWQDTFDTNNGWTVQPNWSVTGGQLVLSWSPGTENYDMSATSPNITVPTGAGDLVINQYVDEYAGQGAAPETYEISIVSGANSTVVWTYSTDADWGVAAGTDLILPLAAYSGQTIQLKFRSFGEDTFNFDYWRVFGITAYASLDQDMAATSLTGSTTPAMGSASNYNVTVRNASTTVAASYTVKLMKDATTELGSQTGTNLAPGETAEFTFAWTPAAQGNAVLTGKVILTGDQNPNNDVTAPLTVEVVGAGATIIQIGNGTAVNGETAVPTPYGTYYKNFREQYLVTAAEMYAAGGAPGLITSLAFNVTDLRTVVAMPNYRVRMKATAQTALTTTFEVGEYTQVWTNASFMPVLGWNTHTFDAPFFWDGASNILVDVMTDLITGDYTRNAAVPYTTTSFNSCLRYQNDTQPASAATTGTVSTNRSNMRFNMVISDTGSLSGTVTTGGSPLAGATVAVEGTVFTTTTSANGTYSLPFVPVGAQQVTASKFGFYPVTHNVTIVEDQASVQDFALLTLPQVTLTGRIVGSDQPTVGLPGTIALSGYQAYNATADANGNFTINNVYANQTYNYVVGATGYANTSGQVVVGSVNVNLGDVIVNEIANPASGVVATEAPDFSNVSLAWNAPGTGPTGFMDDFESYDNFAIAFEPWTLVDVDLSETYGFSGITFPNSGVAMAYIIFNPSATTPVLEQTPHSGAKFAACFASTTPPNNDWMISPQVTVQAGDEVNFWARSYVADYGLERFKVGVSTTGTAPADFTIISGATYVSAPVDWTEYSYDLSAYAGQQVYVGVQCLSNDAFIFFLDDFSIGSPAVRTVYPEVAVNHTTVERSVVTPNPARIALPEAPKTSDNRVMVGYKVWRLLASDQANEAAWTSLTPSNITPTQYVDNTWQPLPSGVYKYAVKAAYTNNVYSTPAFSNEIHKGMMGTLTGTVTEFGTGLPVEGATIVAGTYSGISNAQGVYTVSAYAGTYNVLVTKPGYQPTSQAGVVVTGMQTTTQNFVMTELTLPPSGVQSVLAGNNVNVTWSAPGSGTVGFEDDFESYDNFAIAFEPWTLVDVDLSETYGFSGITFPNSGVAMAYIIFNPSATTPVLEQEPHSGAKFAACFASTTPPNNDWMISPQVTVMAGDQVSFWARSYVADYGLERFKVGVSTTGTAPADFTIISGANYISAPVEWTAYNYDLSSYAGQQVYVGIQCISNDAFIFFVDDFAIGAVPVAVASVNTENDAADLVKMNLETQNIGMLKANELKQYNPATGVVSIQPSIDLSSVVTVDPTRALTGYKVWRLIQGQETNEASWTSLTTNPVSGTAYQDTGWGPLPDGTYKWAVKAVYTGGALSTPALSNPLTKLTQVGTIAGIVRNQQNQPIAGATVASGTVTATTLANGAYSMVVPAGTHSVTASHANYAPSTQTGIVVLVGQTTTANFVLAPTANLLNDGFETYPDFTLTFAPWTLVDVDLSTTYGFSGITFQNSGSAMAYIVFNPSATVPALEETPHGGSKMAASFAATTPPNNDWLITPQVTGAAQLKFWARTYVADYGLERFKVGVSTTGTAPANFTIISGANYVSAPVEWTEYTYDLSSYGNTPIRVGIQCLSNDAFIFFVDDVLITGNSGSSEDPIVPVIATELKSNYPNPFNPETNIAFSMKEAGAVTLEVYNVKGQLVRTLINDVKAAGNHTVVWNGKDNNGRSVSSGIYYYKMNTGKYSSTKKMIMMK